MNAKTLTSAWLRDPRLPNSAILLSESDAAVLADALDEADDSFRSQIECECREVIDGGQVWYDTGTVETGVVNISKALAYLEARGLIERVGGLVRFVGAAWKLLA